MQVHRGTAWVCKSGCGRVCVHVSSGAAPFWLDSFLPLFVFGSAAALEASGPSHRGRGGLCLETAPGHNVPLSGLHFIRPRHEQLRPHRPLGWEVQPEHQAP